VQLIQIYQCFCDETRLRILHLLTRGPLCVCHFQSLLGETQVKISKHLAYLKEKGLVAATRHQNWMIYRLPARPSPELEKNLNCLQDCVQKEPIFKKDLVALKSMHRDVKWIDSALDCCAKAPCCPGEKKTSKSGRTVGGAA
jgi:ArsR family transcriptional regulator, arsenate/arsenite/antimonite-responsive transcriptional repressor